MSSEVTSDMDLTLGENHMTEKHKLEPTRQQTCELDELAPAPAIRSCDYGQRILYFDIFQMRNI